VAYAAARTLESVGRHRDALERFLEALAAETGATRLGLLHGLTRSAHAADALDHAAERLAALVAARPERPELALWRAYLLRCAGRAAEAVALLAPALARMGAAGLGAAAAQELRAAGADLGALPPAAAAALAAVGAGPAPGTEPLSGPDGAAG
jgi:tetratricopeptide (TPR) repeat protein